MLTSRWGPSNTLDHVRVGFWVLKNNLFPFKKNIFVVHTTTTYLTRLFFAGIISRAPKARAEKNRVFERTKIIMREGGEGEKNTPGRLNKNLCCPKPDRDVPGRAGPWIRAVPSWTRAFRDRPALGPLCLKRLKERSRITFSAIYCILSLLFHQVFCVEFNFGH